MRPTEEWTRIRHSPELNLEVLHARFVRHAYPRHSHDYYVISLIAHGRQSFLHRGTRYTTPAGGVILINPEAVHTGEAVDERGFELRSIYPTAAHMDMAARELTGRSRGLPFFGEVRIDHPWAARNILSLHRAISGGHDALESESRFMHTLAQLVRRYGDIPTTEQKLGREKEPVRRVREYIHEHFAEGIALSQLAREVALSPYYLLRAFCAEVGMPPYTYLESVRIRHTQRLIEAGRPLNEVAAETGFSSQSHMTRSFKKIIGVTPGEYARQIHH